MIMFHFNNGYCMMTNEILVKQVVSKAALLSLNMMKFSSFHGNELIATLMNGLVDNQDHSRLIYEALRCQEQTSGAATGQRRLW